MRQSCRIVNDQVFGHVCGGDHSDADRADELRATPRGGRYGPPDTRRVCHRSPPCGMCPCEPESGYRTPGAPHEPSAPGRRGKSPGRRGGSEGREKRPDLGIRAGAGPGCPRSGPGLKVRSLPYDEPRLPRNGLRPRYRPPEAAAGPAVAQGCWATWLRDTGTTGHGPIRRPRAADLAVPGEGVWQSGNWPESAATCLRDPCCRCGRSGGCRGSCRRRGCWSGRRSR
jgi:hypothetical protein